MQTLSINFRAVWGMISLSAIALIPFPADAQVISVYQLPELPPIVPSSEPGSEPSNVSRPEPNPPASVVIDVDSSADDRLPAVEQPAPERGNQRANQRGQGRGRDKPKHSKRDRDKGNDDNEQEDED